MTISSLKTGFSGDSLLAGNDDPGAMVPLQTYVVPAGGVSSVTFSSISQNFAHLQIRGIGIYGYVNTLIQFNGDTGSNYTYHELYGGYSGGNVTGSTGSSTGQTSTRGGISTSASYPSPQIIDILDYSSVSKNKTIRVLHGADTNATADSFVGLRSGAWLSLSAITSIKLYPASGSYSQFSQFALYGVKSI